ncbi:MAG: hypothetical protein WC603_02485 [Candidatus Paceibacterota bacterium]|jgi:hypothetical protein
MVTLETPIEELVERYTKDILYDCHSVEARIDRSPARVCLQLKGKEALDYIAKEMESLFSSGEIDYDLFMAYVRLICGIIEEHNLPEAPYLPNVKYGNQNPLIWINYCKANGCLINPPTMIC